MNQDHPVDHDYLVAGVEHWDLQQFDLHRSSLAGQWHLMTLHRLSPVLKLDWRDTKRVELSVLVDQHYRDQGNAASTLTVLSRRQAEAALLVY